MRSRIAATVLALCLLGFAVVALLRECPRYIIPLLPIEADGGAAARGSTVDADPRMPLPSLFDEARPPAPRSRGFDSLWPGAAPRPPAAEDLRPAEDLAPVPPRPEARPSPAPENYLSLGKVAPAVLPYEGGRPGANLSSRRSSSFIANGAELLGGLPAAAPAYLDPHRTRHVGAGWPEARRVRWAPLQRAEDLDAAQQLRMIGAEDLPPSSPIDLDLAGPLAVRGVLLHEPALRCEVRGSAGTRPEFVRHRRRALNHYRETLRRHGGLGI